MKNAFLTILIFCLLIAVAGCRKSETSSSSDSGGLEVFGTPDQTQEAIDLINSANGDLKKIKEIYKENEDGVQRLKDALNQKDESKVKEVAEDLVSKINQGMNLGTEAVNKIEQVEDLNINETFKEYLQLKEQALKKQLDAFELRRQVGMKIIEAYGSKDKLKINLTKAEMTENEEKFKANMAEARELSMQANQIYKDSLHKSD